MQNQDDCSNFAPMNLSLFVARRLSISTDGRRSSPAIKVSVTAVALSVAVMLAAVAVVLGFKREIREKVIGFNSHITLYTIPSGPDDDNLVTVTHTLRTLLDAQPYITDYSLVISMPAILKTNSDFKGIYLKSLAGKQLTDFIKHNLESGEVPDFSKEDSKNKILISRLAANQLGLKVGDRIDTYFITGEIRVRPLKVAGIFNTHFDSYDRVMAYGSMPLIRQIAGVNSNQGSSLQINTDNFGNVEQNTMTLAENLQEAAATGLLYRNYRVENAISQGGAYFHWLALLDMNVAVILTLMTIVAVATLISGMLILILDKKRFIGVMRALGATIGDVRKVFIYLALRVALVGMLIGNVLMLLILWCQNRWHFLPLDPEAYYIDFVPVEINWLTVILLNVGCFAIIYLSLVLPSRFVAGISPTDAMRAE